jgi:hypothetical protein
MKGHDVTLVTVITKETREYYQKYPDLNLEAELEEARECAAGICEGRCSEDDRVLYELREAIAEMERMLAERRAALTN